MAGPEPCPERLARGGVAWVFCCLPCCRGVLPPCSLQDAHLFEELVLCSTPAEGDGHLYPLKAS